MGNLMILHLAGATIEFANFVNYNCHPLGDCYKQPTVHVPTCSHSLTIHLHLRSVQLIRLMHSQQCFSHVRSTPRQRGREDEILDLKVPTPPPPPDTHQNMPQVKQMPFYQQDKYDRTISLKTPAESAPPTHVSNCTIWSRPFSISMFSLRM